MLATLSLSLTPLSPSAPSLSFSVSLTYTLPLSRGRCFSLLSSRHCSRFRRKAFPSWILCFCSLRMCTRWGQRLTATARVLVKCMIYSKLHSFPPPDVPVDTRGKGEAAVAASATKGCICDLCIWGRQGWRCGMRGQDLG